MSSYIAHMHRLDTGMHSLWSSLSSCIAHTHRLGTSMQSCIAHMHRLGTSMHSPLVQLNTAVMHVRFGVSCNGHMYSFQYSRGWHAHMHRLDIGKDSALGCEIT